MTAPAATTSDSYRWLAGRSRPARLHLGKRGTSWIRPRECHGGMGGQDDGGYRAACGAWCVLGEDLVGRVPRCAECVAIAARDGAEVT